MLIWVGESFMPIACIMSNYLKAQKFPILSHGRLFILSTWTRSCVAGQPVFTRIQKGRSVTKHKEHRQKTKV